MVEEFAMDASKGRVGASTQASQVVRSVNHRRRLRPIAPEPAGRCYKIACDYAKIVVRGSEQGMRQIRVLTEQQYGRGISHAVAPSGTGRSGAKRVCGQV